MECFKSTKSRQKITNKIERKVNYMNAIIIKVKGMVCNGCENRIRNALKTIDGIQEVHANYKQEIVTIKTNLEIDKSIIYERIEDLGFEVEKED